MNSDGKVVYGGGSCREDRFIAPTIIDNITWDSKIMNEEVGTGLCIYDRSVKFL